MAVIARGVVGNGLQVGEVIKAKQIKKKLGHEKRNIKTN